MNGTTAGYARLTVSVPLELKQRVQLICARRRLSMDEYLTETLEERLAKDLTLSDDDGSWLTLTARADPVLAELWGNEKDAAYESLGHEAQTCESSLWLETKGRAIMSAVEMLQSVQYVVYPDGRPAAVQMSMDTWNALLAWLEDVEDRALVKAVLPKLRQGPQRSGALRWEDVKGDWNATQTG